MLMSRWLLGAGLLLLAELAGAVHLGDYTNSTNHSARTNQIVNIRATKLPLGVQLEFSLTQTPRYRVALANDFRQLIVEFPASEMPIAFDSLTYQDALIASVQSTGQTAVRENDVSKAKNSTKNTKSASGAAVESRTIKLTFDLNSEVREEHYTLPPMKGARSGERLIVELIPVAKPASVDEDVVDTASAGAEKPADATAPEASKTETTKTETKTETKTK